MMVLKQRLFEDDDCNAKACVQLNVASVFAFKNEVKNDLHLAATPLLHAAEMHAGSCPNDERMHRGACTERRHFERKRVIELDKLLLAQIGLQHAERWHVSRGGVGAGQMHRRLEVMGTSAPAKARRFPGVPTVSTGAAPAPGGPAGRAVLGIAVAHDASPLSLPSLVLAVSDAPLKCLLAGRMGLDCLNGR